MNHCIEQSHGETALILWMTLSLMGKRPRLQTTLLSGVALHSALQKVLFNGIPFVFELPL
jgi:hypothetical protein